jgi:hypothetical protein
MSPRTSPKHYVDAMGTTRVSRIEDLPDASVRSYAFGHQWIDEWPRDAQGWGKGTKATEFRFTCECGRWKREVLDEGDGDKLVQAYGGGTMLFPGSDFPKHLAKIEWARRVRAKQRAAARQAKATQDGTVVPMKRSGTDA